MCIYCCSNYYGDILLSGSHVNRPTAKGSEDSDNSKLANTVSKNVHAFSNLQTTFAETHQASCLNIDNAVGLQHDGTYSMSHQGMSNQNSSPQLQRARRSFSLSRYHTYVKPSTASTPPLSPLATTVPVRRHSGSETPTNVPIYSIPFAQAAANHNDLSQASSSLTSSLQSLPNNSQNAHAINTHVPPHKYFTHRRALSGPVSYRFLSALQETPTPTPTLFSAQTSKPLFSAPQQSFVTTDQQQPILRPTSAITASKFMSSVNYNDKMQNTFYSSTSHVASNSDSSDAIRSMQSNCYNCEHTVQESTPHGMYSYAYSIATFVPPNSVPSCQPTNDNDIPVVHVHVDPISSPAISPPSKGSKQFRRVGHSRHLSIGRYVSVPHQGVSHTRNLSLGSINIDHILPQRSSHSRQSSISNLSVESNLTSASGVSTTFLKESELSKFPDSENGYDFAQHFNLFSQYTSNMALQFCNSKQKKSQQVPIPTVWCMSVWNSVVVVGCGNGQIEVCCIIAVSLVCM